MGDVQRRYFVSTTCQFASECCFCPGRLCIQRIVDGGYESCVQVTLAISAEQDEVVARGSFLVIADNVFCMYFLVELAISVSALAAPATPELGDALWQLRAKLI